MDFSTIAAIMSAVIASIAIYFSLRTAREQQALQFEQVKMHRDSDINRWAQGVIELLAGCESFVAVFDPQQRDPDQNEQYRTMRFRLSALIDQGRLFFPNDEASGRGSDKPRAYQGVRQRILNVLVQAYDAFAQYDDMPSDADRGHLATKIGECRRYFVSEAQAAIDPRRFIALHEMNEIKAGKGLDIQKPDGQEPPRPIAKVMKKPLPR